jgi:hypothetical protein
MAAAALTPRVRMMAICDGVRRSKIEADVFHLKGVRQGMNVQSFPIVPPRLWLFVLFSSPRAGDFPCYFRVVNERTDKAVFFGHVEPKPIFGADGGTCARTASIPYCFPDEGRYRVEVWFFQEQGSDVLKGEMPFTISVEGA